MRNFFLAMIIGMFGGVVLFAEEESTPDDTSWDIQTIVFAQGLIRSEASAIALAKVMLEANYGKKFVVLDSFEAKLERQALKDVWQIYAVLTADQKSNPKSQKKLLIVLDQHSGAIIGLMNFTKKQNPYTPYLLKSRKKGQLDNKNLAIAYATTMLHFIDETLVEGRSFKARITDGIWYITGLSDDKKNKSITSIKIAQHDGELLAFEG